MANVESILKIENGKIVNAVDSAEKVVNFENVDGQIVTEQIANNAITTAKIAGYAVKSAAIAEQSVTTPKIANNAVTTAKIANNSVTTAKISTEGLAPGVVGATLCMRAKPKIYNTDSNDFVAVALEEAYRINPISGETWSYFPFGGENIGFRVPETGWYSLSLCLQASNPTGTADTTFVVAIYRGTVLLEEVVLTRRPQTNNYRQLLTVSEYFFEVTNVDVAYSVQISSLQNGNIEITNVISRRSWIAVKKIGSL